jgi:hypothetical protein
VYEEILRRHLRLSEAVPLPHHNHTTGEDGLMVSLQHRRDQQWQWHREIRDVVAASSASIVSRATGSSNGSSSGSGSESESESKRESKSKGAAYHVATFVPLQRLVYNNWLEALDQTVVDEGRGAGALAVDAGLSARAARGGGISPEALSDWGLAKYLESTAIHYPGQYHFETDAEASQSNSNSDEQPPTRRYESI